MSLGREFGCAAVGGGGGVGRGAWDGTDRSVRKWEEDRGKGSARKAFTARGSGSCVTKRRERTPAN